MRGALAVALALIAASALAAPTTQTPPPAPGSAVFPVDDFLRPRVQFWVEAYARYHSWDFILHDSRYPQAVFEVLTKPDAKFLEKRRAHYEEILGELEEQRVKAEKNPDRLNKEERQVWDLYKGIGDPDRFALGRRKARVRVQRGLRDQLVESHYHSGKYRSHMERIFREHGLPAEIAYLPYVESGFSTGVISHAGASGMWQFMPYTGKIYLRVDAAVDERNDPMRAAEAAALLMQENYARFQSWPLALTAYNHGPQGLEKAIQQVQSRSLTEIIKRYDSASFGFASENYYASFVAAMHVTKNAWFYLGDTAQARPISFDEFVVPDFVDLPVLAEYTGIDTAVLRELNPALTAVVVEGKRPLPVGYTLRVPMEGRESFLLRYERIPRELRGRQRP